MSGAGNRPPGGYPNQGGYPNHGVGYPNQGYPGGYPNPGGFMNQGGYGNQGGYMMNQGSFINQQPGNYMQQQQPMMNQPVSFNQSFSSGTQHLPGVSRPPMNYQNPGMGVPGPSSSVGSTGERPSTSGGAEGGMFQARSSRWKLEGIKEIISQTWERSTTS